MMVRKFSSKQRTIGPLLWECEFWFQYIRINAACQMKEKSSHYYGKINESVNVLKAFNMQSYHCNATSHKHKYQAL